MSSQRQQEYRKGPLSPILYILYNSDLPEISTENPEDLKLGFIDDIAYAMKGPRAESNAARLSRMLEKANEWKTNLMHNSKLASIGHIPLNQYLHRFHIIESPMCNCGQGVKTIAHYISLQTIYKAEIKTKRES